jgi:hypothetical protein
VVVLAEDEADRSQPISLASRGSTIAPGQQQPQQGGGALDDQGEGEGEEEEEEESAEERKFESAERLNNLERETSPSGVRT